MIEKHTGHLVAAFLVWFATLTLTAWYGAPWGYVAAAWAGGMAWPVCRWYAALLRGY